MGLMFFYCDSRTLLKAIFYLLFLVWRLFLNKILVACNLVLRGVNLPSLCCHSIFLSQRSEPFCFLNVGMQRRLGDGYATGLIVDTTFP